MAQLAKNLSLHRTEKAIITVRLPKDKPIQPKRSKAELKLFQSKR
jgi:hypothetical protein